MPTGPANDADPLIGQTLGDFEIVELIGRGGMGAVYKARQPSLDRFVAIKILSPVLSADEAFVSRFTREARAAAAVSHRHIIGVIEIGQAGDHHYIAMEYLEGESLAAILDREGRLDQGRALAAMKQAAAALAAAHKAGIVHRDIKPSNLMLDAEGEVRITDFGLAKRLEGDVTTTDGQPLGTPAYVAPEMAMAKAVDGRTDLYSLGATFFHALAGRPPFEGESFSDVMFKQVNEPAPSLREAAPDVDPRLCDMIDRLLRKDPAERHPSAKALLEELEALGELATPADAAQPEGRAVIQEAPTRTLTEGRRLEREAALEQLQSEHGPPRKRRRLLAAIGIAALGLGAAVAVVVSLRPPRPKAAIAELRGKLGKAKEKDKEKHKGKEKDKEPPPPPPPGEWASLFDGKTLRGWRVVAEGRDFVRHGRVYVDAGRVVLERGAPRTGIAWMGEFPTVDYEIALEARREAGNNCFCDILFPIGASTCLLNVGGWGQDLVGLTCVDGQVAPNNETGRRMHFENGRWYRIRLRVTEPRIEAWIDEEKVIDLPTAGHTFTTHIIPRPLKPFGICNFSVGSALRNIRLRRVEPGPPP